MVNGSPPFRMHLKTQLDSVLDILPLLMKITDEEPLTKMLDHDSCHDLFVV